MNWLEIWAFLKVIGIILSAIVFIIYILLLYTLFPCLQQLYLVFTLDNVSKCVKITALNAMTKLIEDT